MSNSRPNPTSGPYSCDDDVDEFDRTLQQLIETKIDPKSAASTIASEVTKSASIEGELSSLWGSILAAAQANPTMHPQLVSTLTNLASLPDALDKEGCPVKIWGMVLWSEMPTWNWEVADEWNRLQVPEDQGPGRTEAIRAWHAQNRFSAMLFNTAIPSLQTPLQALWSFRSALEDENSPSDLDIHVPAAAVWIEDAGKLILACDEQFPPGGGGQPGKGGKHWSGQHGFSHARWEMWKFRFATIGENEDVSNIVREVARGAALRMAELDASA